MTSLLITSQSKERPFIPFTNKLYLLTQQPVTPVPESQAYNYHQAKILLTEDAILPELLSDNLSDVPDDILSE
jgi:hypothetical protein